MTDLQVKYQGNLLRQQELDLDKQKLAHQRAELAEQKRANVAKEAENIRSNKMTEALRDREAQAKYGYDTYMPTTDEGQYAKDSAWGMFQIPFDILENKFMPLFPGMSFKF